MDTEPTVPEDAMTLMALAGAADTVGFFTDVSSSISIGVSSVVADGAASLLSVHVALFSSTSMSAVAPSALVPRFPAGFSPAGFHRSSPIRREENDRA